MQNDFSEQFRSISNTELLDILENTDEYQPVAVEAAKAEFIRRNLTAKEIDLAKQPLIDKQAQKEKEREKVKVIEDKIKKARNTFFDTINPIQSGIPTAEKKIRLIVIIYGGLFLYEFIRDFREYTDSLKDFTDYPIATGLYFITILLLPVSVFLFWRKKKAGWNLLAVYITFSLAGVLLMIYRVITWKSTGYTDVDNLFPRPSPAVYIFRLLFFGGTLYTICQQDIREDYQVTRKRMIEITGITAFISFLLMLAVSYA